MKKVLLSLTIAAFTLAAVAQNNQFLKPDKLTAPTGNLVRKNIIDIKAPTQTTPASVAPHHNGAKSVNKIRISQSYNPYSVLISESTNLTANQDLGLIQFTHRTNLPTINGNQIISSFSTDGGNTWDTTNIVYNNSGFPARYPSGVIWNPAGNTNPLKAYSVVAGPFLNASGAGWIGSYFASMRLDTANRHVDNLSQTAALDSINMARDFMIATNNNVWVNANWDLDNGTNYTSFKTIVNKGVFNSSNNSFTWTQKAMVPDYAVTASTGLPDGVRTPGITFTKDGKTGYLAYIGRHKTGVDTLSYIPMVYKTTDSGTTWTMLPNTTNFATLTDIAPTLTTTSAGTTRPSFGLIKDVLVDCAGNLHMAVFINSAASDHPDSLGYSWNFTAIQGYMFDVFTTTAGGWDATYVGTCHGKTVTAAGDTQLGIGWDERFQMSKSDDGTKIFYIWTDTDTTFLSSPDYFSLLPDVYITGVVATDPTLHTSTLNLTSGTYQGDNFWMYASDITLKTGTTYNVPITTTTTGSVDTDPVTHYFLKGVSFQESDFVTNPGIKENSLISDVQNYPNPCRDFTKIEVNLIKSANLSVEIYNMVGQKIMQVNKGFANPGINHVTINTSSLCSGVYFYTVKAGNNTITKKLIVE
ncbi:MAG: T9SS type A sorting domain-containing protein [Bacteroidota bacterium]